ncbi:MAG: BolA family protein [Vampirovibrionales bacterium]|nr:BolA family protein [Vampirovibrionales bacterium]
MPQFVDHIKAKLKSELNATDVEIIDESWKHAGHAQNTSAHATGTHLQIKVTSELFRNMPLMEQHRLIHGLLKEEMATRIHALSLKTDVPR